MATQKPVAGVCYVKIDGTQYALRAALKVNLTMFMREGVAGQDGIHGFKETPMIPSIEAEFTDLGNLSVKALLAISNATVTAELANGKTYILSEAWYAGEASIETTDGKIPAKFEGRDILEVTA